MEGKNKACLSRDAGEGRRMYEKRWEQMTTESEGREVRAKCVFSASVGPRCCIR